jgi:hypothetical protein
MASGGAEVWNRNQGRSVIALNKLRKMMTKRQRINFESESASISSESQENYGGVAHGTKTRKLFGETPIVTQFR